jgi:hypothetical protein
MMRERELRHFMLLDRDEQEAAIRRLAASGMSDYGIATTTRLTVQQVRRILAATTKAVPA